MADQENNRLDQPPHAQDPGEPAERPGTVGGRGERLNRQVAADRARNRAAEARARVAELRERLAALRSRRPNDPPDPVLRARQAADNAAHRRDEAAQRDRMAHDAAARAHEHAALAYEHLASTADPELRPHHVRKADFHREAAKADRLAGSRPPAD
jgi:hypothetical protein